MKNEMQLNYHEQSRCKCKENNMTYVLTWGLGSEEFKCPECRVGEETHLLVIESFSIPRPSNNSSLFRTYFDDIRAKPRNFILLILFRLSLPLVPRE
jgi:hypothetical protein